MVGSTRPGIDEDEGLMSAYIVSWSDEAAMAWRVVNGGLLS